MVADEGGAVVENVFRVWHGNVRWSGIAEKGLTNIEFQHAKSNGGHASYAPVHTIVGIGPG